MAVGGQQEGRKPPSRTAILRERRIEHSCFFAILGPSTVDLVAAHDGGSVGGGADSGGVVVVGRKVAGQWRKISQKRRHTAVGTQHRLVGKGGLG